MQCYSSLFVETAEPVHDGFNYLRNTYFYQHTYNICTYIHEYN